MFLLVMMLTLGEGSSDVSEALHIIFNTKVSNQIYLIWRRGEEVKEAEEEEGEERGKKEKEKRKN